MSNIYEPNLTLFNSLEIFIVFFIVLWQKENSFRIVNGHLLLWNKRKIEMVNHHSLKNKNTHNDLKKEMMKNLRKKGDNKMCYIWSSLRFLHTRWVYLRKYNKSRNNVVWQTWGWNQTSKVVKKVFFWYFEKKKIKTNF